MSVFYFLLILILEQSLFLYERVHLLGFKQALYYMAVSYRESQRQNLIN